MAILLEDSGRTFRWMFFPRSSGLLSVSAALFVPPGGRGDVRFVDDIVIGGGYFLVSN